ncbi:unnamed protein product [Rotaria sp. Silwood1]|nr:unnamed protein product [Rotaria sp. Silwood1]CAF0835812.1 unnamed protein product [Rotaria sp. Silwood1]CAF3339747.1 unnamed protein product [Rotaria sp. Silwood1]CAF3366745.1 unnamed protein product [Rotaria sp. Silwood1]CAF4869291.1 unnamed protein product [Rotaria sp. Silwood1]
MNMLKILKNYIRGFNYESNIEMTSDYTIESIQMETGIHKDLSMIVLFLFFAIFWLGIENYTDIVQYIIDFARRRRN